LLLIQKDWAIIVRVGSVERERVYVAVRRVDLHDHLEQVLVKRVQSVLRPKEEVGIDAHSELGHGVKICAPSILEANKERAVHKIVPKVVKNLENKVGLELSNVEVNILDIQDPELEGVVRNGHVLADCYRYGDQVKAHNHEKRLYRPSSAFGNGHHIQ